MSQESQAPQSERRTYTVTGRTSGMGKSSCTIRCPFCGHETTAYIWSLAGSGKRCCCNALHTYDGTSTREKAKPC